MSSNQTDKDATVTLSTDEWDLIIASLSDNTPYNSEWRGELEYIVQQIEAEIDKAKL